MTDSKSAKVYMIEHLVANYSGYMDWVPSWDIFQSREKAEEEVKDRNQKLLDSENRDLKLYHDNRTQTYLESIALTNAGLRTSPLKDPGAFVPKTVLWMSDPQYRVVEVEFCD